MSPFSKTTLDINKLYVSSPITSKIPDEGEDKKDKADDTTVCKQGRSAWATSKQIILDLVLDNDVLINLCILVIMQISQYEKKVTMIKTKVMMQIQKPLLQSHQQPQKTSNAKTLQVHCIPGSDIITAQKYGVLSFKPYTDMPPVSNALASVIFITEPSSTVRLQKETKLLFII